MISKFPPLNEQMDAIRRGAVDIISEEELARKIERSIEAKSPLRIKFGADPSSPDLHIGHGVPLGKLRTFQDLGHQAVLIIGDFTAMIGDPSGKSKTRPMLTVEETKANAATYVEQVTRVLNGSALEIRYNSEWLNAMNFVDVIRLTATFTVSQMLERDDFDHRFHAQQPISLHEFLYPLAQGMDSVAIRSDVELGGTDQRFNLLVGRDLQRHHSQEPQVVITMPLLEGTNGVKKMSKSYGNSINFSDEPNEIFGKTMSIPDTMIFPYFELATWVNDLIEIKKQLADPATNPRNLKVRLAQELVRQFYGEESAQAALDHFTAVFVKKEIPDDIEELQIPRFEGQLTQLLTDLQLVPSKSEARRMIKAGAISIDGAKVIDANAAFTTTTTGNVLKVGKKKFVRVSS